MKSNKKTIKRVVAMLLAVFMVGAALISVLPLFVSAADEGTLSYPISDYNPGVPCPDPIPLLCIVVNFDANNNGVDDNPDGKNYGRVTNKNDELYGEQWCHFTHDVWAEMLFGDEGRTLKNYYKLMSNGKFYFTPAPETYVGEGKNGAVNDGVVEVVIHGKHLNTQNDYVYYFKSAIQQIDEYVDFSVFDTNENGKIDEYELIISFINGGAELAQTSYNELTSKEAFRSRAYYRKHNASSPLTCDADGYTVGYGGLFTTGSWGAKSSRADKATEFAVWAHELGHYLGAPDYYDTDKSASGDDPGYHYTVGYYSLMAKGCHGSQPSHIDPFTMTKYGFCKATDVQEDGTYTLFSKTSSEDDYNIIKINTPNPNEYYLVENRYASSDYEGEAFDNYNIASKQGIIIWHVDESHYNSTAANNSNDGFDPTLAVYATNTKNIKRSISDTILAAFGGTVDVFEPTTYKFPKSGTWYTSMTPEQAETMKNLKIEVISEPGEEMQIKVTGSYKQVLMPEISMFAEWTKNSVTVNGKIETLNYATLTSAKFTLSEKKTGTVVKTQDMVFNSDYSYEIPCDGLKPGTNYEIKIEGQSSHGAFTVVDDNFTKPEEVKRVTITLVINSDQYKTTTQTVNVGSTHTIRVQPTKRGYYLEGWYLDEEYTKPYTQGVIEKEGDFTIYAKWVEGKDPSKTTAAPVQTTPAATTAGTTAPVQNQGGNGGANPAPIIIAVVAVVLVIGIIIAVVLSKKKAPNGEGKNK